jgi:hypothetical protein
LIDEEEVDFGARKAATKLARFGWAYDFPEVKGRDAIVGHSEAMKKCGTESESERWERRDMVA